MSVAGLYRRRSLRVKAVIIMTLTSIIALVAASAIVIVYEVADTRGAMVEDLEGLCLILGENSSASLIFLDEETALETLGSLATRRHVVSAVLRSAGGEVFAEYHRGGEAGGRELPWLQENGNLFTSGMLIASRDIEVEGERVGSITIAADLAPLHARVRKHALMLGLVILGSTLLIVLISARLQRVISRPILELAGIAKTISAEKNFRMRARKLADDELGELTDSFNAMLDEIEQRDIKLLRAYRELDRSKVVEVQREVGERRRAEEALRKSEEALLHSQKMESIGRLAGGVAHDFNNLLTAIRGYTQILLKSLEPGGPQFDRATQISKACDRAAALTRQLLAFGRKQVLSPKVLDLNEVVANMEGLLSRSIGEKIRLTTDLDPALGAVRADPGQIEQVVMNLVVNARDALLPSGGEVVIRTRNLGREDVDFQPGTGPPDHGYALISVRDNGCGMDEATRENAFEPFFTTKPQGMGTGLGLATAYGIVSQSGGTIRVESAPGEGSEFLVYLPRVVADAAPAREEEVREAPPMGSETILLVEDEELVRELSEEILNMGGYRVLVARDGEEALQVARDHPGKIDLMLTDVVMPRMTGPESAQRMAEIRPETKVLFMSGYMEFEDLDRIDLARKRLIHKPFETDALLRTLRDVLAGTEAA